MRNLWLLGTGTPTPTPERFGTAYVLQIGEQYVMVDCGPATTYKLVRAGLWPTQIDHLFFTHLHSDHCADYPCFMLCRFDQSTGKENAIEVYGPEPTSLMTERLLGDEGAFIFDIEARINHPTSQSVHQNRGGSLPRPAPAYSVTDIEPGAVIERNGWKATAAHAQHVQPWLRSLAYRFETPNRSVTFAGDTEPCDGVIELAAGTDVLVVNCWDHQSTMDENGEAPAQTGTIDAARMASVTDAAALMLTHTGPALCKPGSRERAIGDISGIFGGEVIFGEELMHIQL